MSHVRRYRTTVEDSGVRRVEYREAWILEDEPMFTVHHGRLGHPGTVKDQQVASPEEATELLDAFVAQCEEDGFTVLADDDVATVSVLYRLRGEAVTRIENQHTDTLRTEITHQLAWRGLGEVTDVIEQPGQMLLLVRTPHAAKAAAEIPAAAKRAHGVQPNKVQVRLGDLRTQAGESA
ncbi:MAG: hypothetical protein Q4G34_09850 [Micrococcus sp.]|nr:hypothetical protein [Micrococcus sp.]